MAEILFPAFDPVLFSIGFVQIRWYGLMYVVGFVFGQWILTRLARQGFWPLPEAKVGDLVLFLLLGVILGGRLGFVLFYRPDYLTDPGQLIRVWEGGLSFHGGLLGVGVAFTLFAWRNKVSALRVGDCCALAVLPGIFAVRIANFINGELYGRTTDASVPFAMRFPTDPVAQKLLGVHDGMPMRERELLTLQAYADGRWDAVRDAVPLRHPSQLYEAAGEGLVLGLVLWFIYRATAKAPLHPGIYGGIFVFGYGVIRFAIEYFREPDAHFQTAANPTGTFLFALSMGQLLCVAMMAVGLALIFFRRTSRG